MNTPNTASAAQILSDRQQQNTTSPLCAIAVLPARSSPATRELEASFGPGSRVDLQHCIYREQCSDAASSYIIKSASTGSRTIVNYNNLPEMTVSEFVEIAERLAAAACCPRWFHFEGRIPAVTLKCIQYLRQSFPGDKVSVEVEKPGREGLQDLAAIADVVFYSKSWAQANGHGSLEGFLRAQSPLTPRASILCCTWGERGAACLHRGSMEYIHSPAYIDTRRPVVDTIGAGDTFIAGMLHHFIRRPESDGDDDFSLLRAMDFANHLAGRKVVQEGFEGLGAAAICSEAS
ncbi:kinase, pfkB family protein [Histoplasma capsulatum var. duboisii H88]|uniref:Kinase, pfkB family protein n=1 Tax=Ajellomyces capsulatus (strain H88) TaxID=544711 RepID=A0A8A1LE90_AJEC8|nr:kinase, pfkB family protein [Histoplasma capsulatum var. duboisii H88]